jgi:uncharacterized membrane protein YhhN
MSMITFVIYCLTGIVNLGSAFFFKEGLRKISKGCLMPALLVFYLWGAEQVLFTVIAALILSWAGDIFLIYKEKQIFFKLGLAAFLVSHIFYITAFLMLAGGINIMVLIISLAIAIPLVLAVLKLLNAQAPMKIPVAAYAVVIVLMSMSALQLMLARQGFAGIIIFTASLVYLFSDTFMAYHLFHGKPRYFNFLTMIPYIIAQGGIIMGLVLGFGG